MESAVPRFNGDQTYVRTTSSGDETTVLSEAQSYGMLLTVYAAQKGQANQENFDSLYRYYKKPSTRGDSVDVLEAGYQEWTRNC